MECQELGDPETVPFEEGILDPNFPIHPSAIFWRNRRHEVLLELRVEIVHDDLRLLLPTLDVINRPSLHDRPHVLCLCVRLLDGSLLDCCCFRPSLPQGGPTTCSWVLQAQDAFPSATHSSVDVKPVIASRLHSPSLHDRSPDYSVLRRVNPGLLRKVMHLVALRPGQEWLGHPAGASSRSARACTTRASSSPTSARSRTGWSQSLKRPSPFRGDDVSTELTR